MVRIALLLGLALLLLAGLAGAQDKVLMMATTTSTQDTGILEVLAQKFKAATGIELRWTAVGTGKALELGKACDVDVLLVHAPAAEKKYMDEGFGLARTEVMYNDFVLVGPASDPAGVKGMAVAKALASLAEKKAVFVSRGDDSGTHKAEQTLWKGANLPLPDKESWYVSAGQGMRATLNMAAERKGYTLTDRGTFIAYEADAGANPPLVVLVEKDTALFNQYSVIPVNPDKCPKVKADLAKAFATWLAGPEGQKAVADFTLKGKPLFTPNAKQ